MLTVNRTSNTLGASMTLFCCVV